MEQFQQVQFSTCPAVQLLQRRDISCAESAVAPLYDVFQVILGDFVFGNVQAEDFKGKVLEAQVLPLLRPVGGQLGDFLWNEEATIGGEPFEDDGFEGELFCAIQREFLVLRYLGLWAGGKHTS